MSWRYVGWAVSALAIFGAGMLTRHVAVTVRLSDGPPELATVLAPASDMPGEPEAVRETAPAPTNTVQELSPVGEPDLHPPVVALLETELIASAKPILSEPDLHPAPLPPTPDIRPVDGPSLNGPIPSKTADREVPDPLPAPESASPIRENSTTEDHSEDALRRMLQRELPEASEDERRIWLEEMKGLSPNAVRDLLHLRRRFDQIPIPDSRPGDETGPLSPRLSSRPKRPDSLLPGISRLAPPGDSLPGSEVLPVLPPDADDESPNIIEQTCLAARRARAILLQNLANAETPGYRRIHAAFVEQRGAAAIPSEDDADLESAAPMGVTLAPLQVDMTPGELLETREPLDIAIDGAGFLAVQVGGHQRFTRCGRLTIDSRHRLAVRCGAVIAPLHPEVLLPEETAAVRIGEDGVVAVQKGSDAEWHDSGRISLVRFLNARDLQPRGSLLFAESFGSGTPQAGQAGSEGYGAIRQGHLEASNVCVECERSELERIHRLVDFLTSAAQVGANVASGVPEEARILPPAGLTPAHPASAVMIAP